MITMYRQNDRRIQLINPVYRVDVPIGITTRRGLTIHKLKIRRLEAMAQLASSSAKNGEIVEVDM